MQLQEQKTLFLDAIKQKAWTYQIFQGEKKGQVALSFDVSHMIEDQSDERIRTLFVMLGITNSGDSFFFSNCSFDNYDALLQTYLDGASIALPNLSKSEGKSNTRQVQDGRILLERNIEIRDSMRDSSNQINQPPSANVPIQQAHRNKHIGKLLLTSEEKISALNLFESSLISEVELIGNSQFKDAVIVINRLRFKEIIRNKDILSKYLKIVATKLNSEIHEQFNTEIDQIIKNVILSIDSDYEVVPHNSNVSSHPRFADQLKLFWPLKDETNLSSTSYEIIKDRRKVLDLKPGHHVFIWPNAISLLKNKQNHGIYIGGNKILELTDNSTIEIKSLDQFKQNEKLLSVCEYGVSDFDSIFRRKGTFSKKESDHPFKILMKTKLISSLKNPLKLDQKNVEVDYIAKLCKMSSFCMENQANFCETVDHIVNAFCDTFFISLGD